jgi:hypothetical protein
MRILLIPLACLVLIVPARGEEEKKNTLSQGSRRHGG